MAIYVWKVVNNFAPNPRFKYINNPRTGIHTIYTIEKEKNAPGWLRKIKKNSALSKCATIFNSLPRNLRSLNTAESIDEFKKRLDNVLKNVPDQPTIPGKMRAAEYNSLVHQIPYYIQNY